MEILQQILATPPKNYNPKKGGDITPLESRRFTITERARNWTMEMSKRDDNRICDVVRYRYKYIYFLKITRILLLNFQYI